MGGFYRRLFAPENVVILANPTGCLNDGAIFMEKDMTYDVLDHAHVSRPYS